VEAACIARIIRPLENQKFLLSLDLLVLLDQAKSTEEEKIIYFKNNELAKDIISTRDAERPPDLRSRAGCEASQGDLPERLNILRAGGGLPIYA
jgi:hypothetical protein